MNYIAYKLHLHIFFVMFLTLMTLSSSTFAVECSKTNIHSLKSVTVPLTLQLPDNTVSLPSGAVLYKREASLASLIGFSKNIFGNCTGNLPREILGRLSGRDKGQRVFSTDVPGIGLRLTFIFDKPGMAKQVFILPFRSSLKSDEWKDLTTNDIKIRLEIIKTDESGSMGEKLLPIFSVLKTSDNSLNIGLLLRIKLPNAHCIATTLSSQINLPPVNIDDLVKNKLPPAVNLGIEVKCSSAHLLAISTEGVASMHNPAAYDNTAEDHAAKGVGFEVFYNGKTMFPERKYNINLAAQSTLTQLPITVRYVKLLSKINSGKVKAEITLHVNYL